MSNIEGFSPQGSDFSFIFYLRVCFNIVWSFDILLINVCVCVCVPIYLGTMYLIFFYVKLLLNKWKIITWKITCRCRYIILNVRGIRFTYLLRVCKTFLFIIIISWIITYSYFKCSWYLRKIVTEINWKRCPNNYLQQRLSVQLKACSIHRYFF